MCIRDSIQDYPPLDEQIWNCEMNTFQNVYNPKSKFFWVLIKFAKSMQRKIQLRNSLHMDDTIAILKWTQKDFCKKPQNFYSGNKVEEIISESSSQVIGILNQILDERPFRKYVCIHFQRKYKVRSIRQMNSMFERLSEWLKSLLH
eukprot:TRINITY_DN5257_c0_g1_i14.p1 TRINITY_DN5257_c0_g1~~TRINITY_DN5257_c0_g1_i14.p1  ORF type:complete len:146 (-),score=8.83 TRINITY_DN5257_c0_g1_i14:120-557(-)